MTNTPYTSPEAVGRLAARLYTSRQPSIGQRRSIADTLRTLSAALEGEKARVEAAEAELARLKQRVLDDTEEIQDMTQDHMDTIKAHLELERRLSTRAEAAEAERDALKAELAEAVEAIKFCARLNVTVIEKGERARAFLSRQKETDT